MQEHYEVITDGRYKHCIRYTYHHPEGHTYTAIATTLERAIIMRDKWLAKLEKEKAKCKKSSKRSRTS